MTLTNRSDHAIYLRMDTYVLCDRLVAGEWRDPIAWFVVDGVGNTFRIGPGESHSDGLDLRYLDGRPGTYRFRYLAYRDPDARSPVALEERVSPPFEVVP